MQDEPPPVRPRRRPIQVYLTPDERECLDRGAKASGLPRGTFLRRVALYRAGWQGYSGPLFERSGADDLRRLELHQVGDGLHEVLRTLRELGTTIVALYDRGASPGQSLLRLALAHARMLCTLGDELGLLRHFDDTLEIVFELEKLGSLLAPHHGIAGKQIEEAAELALAAITRKGHERCETSRVDKSE